jgi:hypothetical protein
MVYRPKSGFVDPRKSAYHAPEFLAHLRSAADNDSPIGFVLVRKRLLRACDLLFRRRELPAYTRYCLWAIAFADRWYRTAANGGR